MLNSIGGGCFPTVGMVEIERRVIPRKMSNSFTKAAHLCIAQVINTTYVEYI